MRIESIEFRNIASYGNQVQKLDLSNKKGCLYLTVGQNGIGKSTIAKAIIFGLYGRVDGFNLNDLPNRINKNLWVKIKVICGKRRVVIERGLSPKTLKVEINGVEKNQARKLQEYLEDEVYEIPYRVFKNIIVLSIDDFKSFLTMTPKDKRNIIDKLFGFSIINEMFERVRSLRKDLSENLDSVKSELRSITESIETTANKLNELEKISTSKSKERIKELKNNLVKLNEDKKKLSDAKDKLIDQYNNTENNLEKYKDDYNKKNEKLKIAKRKLKLYENSRCPECNSKLDTKFHKGVKQKQEDIVKTIPDELNAIEDKINNLKESVNNNREKQHQVISKISSLSMTMSNIKSELIKISEGFKNDDSEFEYLRSLIRDFKKKERRKTSMQSNKSEENHFLSMVEDILGDGGVKNMAIKSILPGLNATIAAMTQEMHLNFHIRFDEKFNCIVNHLGEDINPATLSTGQKKKANFIIITAIIKLLKLRFPDLNILFLDEIFSGVDSDGIYAILKILNNVIKEYKLNTFVINHSILPEETFDKKIEVYHDNGFSKLNIETIV